MNLRTLFVTVATALCACAAHADEPVVSDQPGQIVEAVWADGRKAQFQYKQAPVIDGDINFEVTENECTGTLGNKFSLHISLRFEMAQWVWVAHPEAAKVGQTLFNDDGLFGQAFYINGAATQFLTGQVPADLPPDEVTFEGDMSWIPGVSAAGAAFTLPLWTAEAMLPNPQTGVNQNRIQSGEYGLRLEPLGGLRYRLAHSGRGAFMSFWNVNAFYLVGDVTSWTFDRPDGSTCSISFKPFAPGLNERVNEYVQNNLLTPFQPYPARANTFIEYSLNQLSEVLHGAR